MGIQRQGRWGILCVCRVLIVFNVRNEIDRYPSGIIRVIVWCRVKPGLKLEFVDYSAVAFRQVPLEQDICRAGGGGGQDRGVRTRAGIVAVSLSVQLPAPLPFTARIR